MKKVVKPVYGLLYVPTLQDKAGLRHIIPRKDAPAYCGVTDGSQQFPHDWKRDELCSRCVEGYARSLLDIRLGEVGL